MTTVETATCIDCGGILITDGVNPCQVCVISRGIKRDEQGIGELICRDCQHVWPEYKGKECHECGADAAERLTAVQLRMVVDGDL